MNRRNKARGAAAQLQAASAQKSTPQITKPSPGPQPSSSSIPPPPISTPHTSGSGPPPATAPAPSPPQPPPGLTPSARLRQEWKAFDVWLAARRADRDKRLADARNPPKQTRLNAFGRKSVDPTPAPAALLGLERKLNQELCTDARIEWEKRLAQKGLNEEDWTDITEAEMRAIEDAFLPPELPPEPVKFIPKNEGRYGFSGPSLTENATYLGADLTSSPGASSFSSINASTSSFATSSRTSFDDTVLGPSADTPKPHWFAAPAQQTPSHPNVGNSANPFSWGPKSQPTQTNTAAPLGTVDTNRKRSPRDPIMRAKAEELPTKRDIQPESLWDSVVNRVMPSTSKIPTPAAPEPQESPWEAAMRARALAASPNPAPPPPFGAAERAHHAAANTKLGAPPTKPAPASPDTQGGLWDTVMKSRTKTPDPVTHSMVPPVGMHDHETPWQTMLSDGIDPHRVMADASQRHFAARQDAATRGNSCERGPTATRKPVVSSPLAAFEPQTADEPHVMFVAISPVTIEARECDMVAAGFEGLSEQDLEDSIRQFYLAAAEADVDLRRQLYASGVSEEERVNLVEEFSRHMEYNARAVWEGWKEARETEKARQLRIAEEEKRAQALEARKAVWNAAGRRDLAPPIARSPSPHTSSKKPLPGKRSKKQSPAQALAAEDDTLHPLSSPFGDTDTIRQSTPAIRTKLSASPERGPFMPPPDKNPFSGPRPTSNARTNAHTAPTKTKQGNVGRVTVADEEDDEGQSERVMAEQMVASYLAQSATPAKATPVIYNAGSGKSAPNQHGLQKQHSAQDPQPPARETAAPPRAPPAVDPRYRTWVPERPPAPGNGGHRGEGGGIARNMVEVAMQNLHEVSLDTDDPADLFNAMSVYTKAVSGLERKRAISTTKR